MEKQRLQELISELQNGTDRQRRAASFKLSNSNEPGAVSALIQACSDSDGSVRQNALNGLRSIGNKEALDYLDSLNEQSFQDQGDKTAETIYKYAAEMMQNGSTAEQIQDRLVEKGLDKLSASIVVQNLMNAQLQAINEGAKKNMLYGALWCIGGIVFTVSSYSDANPGGTFTIAWGAILFGAIQFIKGFANYKR